MSSYDLDLLRTVYNSYDFRASGHPPYQTEVFQELTILLLLAEGPGFVLSGANSPTGN